MLMFSPSVAGLGAASAAIMSLQQALLALSQASGRPAINPGPLDGILGDKTMNAVAAGLQAAIEKIPQDTTMKLVSLALALGVTTSQAKTAVTSYASQLTVVIKAATVAYATGALKPIPPTKPPPTAYNPAVFPGSSPPPVSSASPLPVSRPTKPWYMQWWGIAAVTVGTLGVMYLLLPKKAAAAASAGTAGPGLGMTKAEAFEQFNELYPADSFKRFSSHGAYSKRRSDQTYIDKPMRDQAWNDFTDSLAKDGQITMKQYQSWSSPWRD